jgi:hypothetical protein
MKAYRALHVIGEIETVYCSNVNAMNQTLNIPYLNLSIPEIPETSSAGYTGATEAKVKHANFLLYRSLGLQGPPGAASASFRQPCIYFCYFVKKYL